jgi:predicted translin family RNA/ssDNA-binding protein
MRIFIFQGRKSSPSNEELVTLCSEFLNGGTDTTGEIKSTAGDRKVDEKDVEKTRSIYMQ